MGGLGKNHFGPERTETEIMKAERIIGEELGELGWAESDLLDQRKGDPRKVTMAARLRGESTVTIAWVAKRLAMGSPDSLTRYLQVYRRDRAGKA